MQSEDRQILGLSLPAKINVHLEILGKRRDGFHELRTLFQSVDLHDRLEVQATDDGEIELRVEPAGAAPESEDNLVFKAVRVMQDLCGVRRGARLSLTKGIPAGGGLGGGSADAAGALLLLNDLWSLDLSRAALFELAARLGSDVPFFFHGGLCLGVGRGEEVFPMPDLPPLSLLLAIPEIEISTPEVFQSLDFGSEWRSPDSRVYSFSCGWTEEAPWGAMKNDLQPYVRARWPEIDSLVGTLGETGSLRAGVTGSGAVCYALYVDTEACAKAGHLIGSGWTVHTGTTLGRDRASLRIERIDGFTHEAW